VKIQIEQLSLDPKNARKHSQRNLDAIAASLEKFGQRKPIVVHRGVVLAGNGTLEAAKSLGWTEIEIAEVPDDWDDDTAKAYALADNRTAELAEWDESALAKQLLELQDADWDISELGFDVPDIAETREVDEDEIPEPPVEPVSKVGDIYQLGRHRLMCGSSTDLPTVSKLMGGSKPIWYLLIRHITRECLLRLTLVQPG
jgi:site-specific DNA-methyltransferase (adenine-specific)